MLRADKGYDCPRCRRALRPRGITSRIARREVESSQRLGRHRWRVERSIAWLRSNRRLATCCERPADLTGAAAPALRRDLGSEKLKPL